MSLLKRLHDAVERKNALVIPHVETVAAIHDHVKQHAHVETAPTVSLDMCVMSITSFHRGWRCVLINKEAVGDDFPLIKQKYDKLKYREQGEFVFRLTIWRGKKFPRRQPDFVEGKAVFVKEVSDLKTYNDVLQGVSDMDDFIKEEDEDTGGKAKKPKAAQKNKS